MKSLRNLVLRRTNKEIIPKHQTKLIFLERAGGQGQKTKSRIEETSPNQIRRDKRDQNTGGARESYRTK